MASCCHLNYSCLFSFFPPALRCHIAVLAEIILIYIRPLFLHPLFPFSYLVSTSSFFLNTWFLAFLPLLTNYFSFHFSSGSASMFSCVTCAYARELQPQETWGQRMNHCCCVWNFYNCLSSLSCNTWDHLCIPFLLLSLCWWSIYLLSIYPSIQLYIQLSIYMTRIRMQL